MANKLPDELLAHRAGIISLCQAFGVDRLEVFGSATTGRFDPQRSDFDFIAHFEPDPSRSLGRRYVGFCESLEALLGRPVDVLTDRPIRNIYMRQSVESSRSAFYASAPAKAPA